MEGGGLEAGFQLSRIERIWGGGLPVEANGCTEHTVVAAAVVAAAMAVTRTLARRRTGFPGRGAGDRGRACSASRHPGEEYIDQDPQDQANCHGHEKSDNQRDCEEKRAQRGQCMRSLCFRGT